MAVLPNRRAVRFVTRLAPRRVGGGADLFSARRNNSECECKGAIEAKSVSTHDGANAVAKRKFRSPARCLRVRFLCWGARYRAETGCLSSVFWH